ncbi:hypothetical protein CWO85_01390 [Candidatus Phytoplasma ziziphi]|uniref:DUF2963 domain-containing protein n=1 Tax=Ziziphus jujuba witches'-broom phytoplasma TaxID=135727 RepID=A0A660HMC8_ZIZJU|nr:DUF2963 domain-containing protein [Candidatus Phytoplasma ziziphi]AYJ01183.1 hypothetical protein CWO85_01390 [Candidatus Phytoplasma ziziphi]
MKYHQFYTKNKKIIVLILIGLILIVGLGIGFCVVSFSKKKEIMDQSNEQTRNYIPEHNPSTNIPMKLTNCRLDKTIENIVEYDLSTNNQIKSTNFRSDGQTIENIIEFNPSNEKKLNQLIFDQTVKQ